MSKVIQAENVQMASNVVELAKFGGITPERDAIGKRDRLAVQAKMAKEAVSMANVARQSRLDQIKLATEDSLSIVSKAKEEAQAIIQKANDDRDQIHEEARIAGVEQAKEEAKEAAIEKIALGLETLDSIAKELRELKETYLRAGAEGMIDIINAILHKVIMTEVTFDRDLILRSIERAIEQISAADKINMRINPEDLSAVDEFKQGIHNLIEGVSEINLRTDDGIIRGGLIIETDFGRVDARLEAQISEIIRDVRLTVQGLPIDSLIEQSVEEIEEDLEPSIEPTIEPETASELLISESRQLDEQVADPEIAETPGTPETMETPELVDSTFEREPQLENDSPSHPEDENTVSSTEPEEEN